MYPLTLHDLRAAMAQYRRIRMWMYRVRAYKEGVDLERARRHWRSMWPDKVWSHRKRESIDIPKHRSATTTGQWWQWQHRSDGCLDVLCYPPRHRFFEMDLVWTPHDSEGMIDTWRTYRKTHDIEHDAWAHYVAEDISSRRPILMECGRRIDTPVYVWTQQHRYTNTRDVILHQWTPTTPRRWVNWDLDWTVDTRRDVDLIGYLARSNNDTAVFRTWNNECAWFEWLTPLLEDSSTPERWLQWALTQASIDDTPA